MTSIRRSTQATTQALSEPFTSFCYTSLMRMILVLVASAVFSNIVVSLFQALGIKPTRDDETAGDVL